MKVPNKLSKMLSTAGEKAAYDNACKKLLSNKIILAWIMKSCLQEYRECAIQEIAEKYIEGDLYVSEIPVYPDEETPELIKGLSTEDTTIAEGTVTYDIRFSALIPGTDNRLSLIIMWNLRIIIILGIPSLSVAFIIVVGWFLHSMERFLQTHITKR